MSMGSLHDALMDQIHDLTSAEKQLLKALPKMAKAATASSLRQAFEEHMEVTEGQVERLMQIYQHLEETPKSKLCKAMQGLIEEGKEIIDEKKGSFPAAIDACLIAAAQRVEHYEMSAYGSARAFAEALGLKEVAALLQETLEEESEANEALNAVAETVNAEAAQGADEEGEDEVEKEDSEKEDERVENDESDEAEYRGPKKSSKTKSAR